METSYNRHSQKPTSPQSCSPFTPVKYQHLSQSQIYQEMRNKLDQILCSLLHQKQQYQKQIQLTFSTLKNQYLSNLEQKDKLILQLQSIIKTLTEKSEEVKQQYASQLEAKEQEIMTLRLILKKKYLQELNLQENIKRYQKKQKTQELIRMSYENIESLISLKSTQQPSKKTNISAFNKKSFEKDTQKTRETITKYKNDCMPISTIKKRQKNSSSILDVTALKKYLSQNSLGTNLIKSSCVSSGTKHY